MGTTVAVTLLSNFCGIYNPTPAFNLGKRQDHARSFMHHGPYPLISSEASPGLRFRKAILRALDSLEPSISPLAPFLASDALFIFNSGEPFAAK